MARPSTKQLNYLNGLGYVGAPPQTSAEASTLIDQLKGGMASRKAEKRLVKNRDRLAKQQLRDVTEYLNGIVEMNQQYHICSGFRLEVDNEEAWPETLVYHKAFLPLEVALQFPALLLTPGLLYDDELARVPTKGTVVTAPGQVVAISITAKRGCAGISGGSCGGFFAICLLMCGGGAAIMFGCCGGCGMMGIENAKKDNEANEPQPGRQRREQSGKKTKSPRASARPKVDTKTKPVEPKPLEAKPPEPKPPELRTWTSSGGNFTIKAKLVDVDDDGMVHLEREDGTVTKVPLDKLSEADQEYVTQLRGRP